LGKFLITAALALAMAMEVLTQSAIRRSTRLRVEIPVRVTSLDRMRPFAENCVTVIVSAQGCGFRSSQALQMETPILLSGLPGGGSVTARVVNCLPLGDDGVFSDWGIALYARECLGDCQSSGGLASGGAELSDGGPGVDPCGSPRGISRGISQSSRAGQCSDAYGEQEKLAVQSVRRGRRNSFGAEVRAQLR